MYEEPYAVGTAVWVGVSCCVHATTLCRPSFASRAAVIIGRSMGSAFVCTHNSSAACRTVYWCQYAFCVVLTKTFGFKNWASGPTFMSRWFHLGAPSGRVVGATGGATQHGTSVPAEPREPGTNSKLNSSWCPLNPSVLKNVSKKNEPKRLRQGSGTTTNTFGESAVVML